MSDEELLMFMEEGGFDPSDIATIHHWWDGSDISTLWEENTRITQASQDSVVGAWDDKISGTSLAQTIATRQPTCKIGDGNLLFNGDFLGAQKSLVNWLFGAGVNHNIFAVITPSAISEGVIFAGLFSVPGFGLRINTNKLLGIVGDGGGVNYSVATSTDSVVVDTLQVSQSLFDNDGNIVKSLIDNVYSGGQAAYTLDNGMKSTDTLVCIGAHAPNFVSSISQTFSGTISEVVVTEEITAGELTNLMSYFNTKYPGLPAL